jgi:hypothetical protein
MSRASFGADGDWVFMSHNEELRPLRKEESRDEQKKLNRFRLSF